MFRDFWNRIMGRSREDVLEREREREQGSPEEQQFATESLEDITADRSAGEHLGGDITPEDRFEDDPR